MTPNLPAEAAAFIGNNPLFQAVAGSVDAFLGDCLPTAAQTPIAPLGAALASPAPALPAEPLTAQALDGQAAHAGAAARAYRLGVPGAVADGSRAPLVFVETATPAVAAAAHGSWAAWQHEAVRAGHAVTAVVLSRAPGADAPCEVLRKAIQRASSQGPVTVVLRFDAASLLYRCPALRRAPVAGLVVGPMPLWPLPTQATGEYPLRTFYTLVGWLDAGLLDGGAKAAWQLLGHPLTALGWPGLVQAALWQENMARGALPGEAPAQALASLMGPWLLPGIASVLADDWAVRRAASAFDAGSTAALPLRVLFLAADTEPARLWAGDYARDLFGALDLDLHVELAVGEAPRLAAGAAPAKASSASTVARGKRNAAPATAAAPAAPDASAATPAPSRKATKAPTATRLATRAAKPAAPAARTPKGATAAKPVASAKVSKAAKPAKPDDLTRIEGIGPQIARLLIADGIRRFDELAVAKVRRLQAVLDAAGPRFALAKPGTWPRQAALLAKGDEAAFAALTRALRGGVEA